MIRVDRDEVFPILVSVLDETTGLLVTGRTVSYDIRDLSDNSLTPAVAGTLSESSVESGIYRSYDSIPTAGNYVLYATCSGYLTNTEEITVNVESVFDLSKHQNRSFEDVARANASATASQTARKVAVGETDYIRISVKEDGDADWGSPTSSGIVYAHYTTLGDEEPYKMGGPL